jgi:hypothetical protein
LEENNKNNRGGDPQGKSRPTYNSPTRCVCSSVRTITLQHEHFQVNISLVKKKEQFQDWQYKTLTVRVISMAVVFEYQNQVIFNMTLFDGEPSLSCYSKKY